MRFFHLFVRLFQLFSDASIEPQSPQSKKCKKEIEVLAMPNEILQQIFINLEDEDLLSVSGVCKLFASNAEAAFGQKYSDEFYWIYGYEIFYHMDTLSKYGQKISKIGVDDVSDEDKWFLDMIEQNCCNLKCIDLSEVPKIVSWKG